MAAKENVRFPPFYGNTVGMEVKEILLAHNISNPEKTLEIPNLESLVKLSESRRKKIASLLPEIEGFEQFLLKFEKSYFEKLKAYKETHKREKAFFRKCRDFLPYVKSTCNKGEDVFEDILDFFEVDDYREIEERIRSLKKEGKWPFNQFKSKSNLVSKA